MEVRIPAQYALGATPGEVKAIQDFSTSSSDEEDEPWTEMESFSTLVTTLENRRGHRLSAEQRDICEFVYQHNRLDPTTDDQQTLRVRRAQRAHLVIDSVAGSGKTSTLLMCLWFMHPSTRVLLLSFNKSVQQTLNHQVNRTATQLRLALRRSLPQCSTFTCHAHGLAALRRHFVGVDNQGTTTDNKRATVDQAVQELIQEEIDRLVTEHRDGGDDFFDLTDDDIRGRLGDMVKASWKKPVKKWAWHIQRLLKLLMNLAIDCTPTTQWSTDFIVQAAEKYGIPIPSSRGGGKEKRKRQKLAMPTTAVNEWDVYMRILRRAYEMCCQRTSGFDFSDMVYLPVRLDLPLHQYDVILIDESQDLNAIQIEMISRSLPPEEGAGQVIFVGDKNQAIYGFRGADTHAMDTIKQRFQTASLPLHICWRCSEAVVEVAQVLVPHIQPRPGAPVGVASQNSEYFLLDVLKQRDQARGHMVLCRTNAPLVKLALQLLSLDIYAVVCADSFKTALIGLTNLIQNASWIRGARNFSDRVEKFRTFRKANSVELGEEFIEKTDQLDTLYAIVKSMESCTKSWRRSSPFSPPPRQSANDGQGMASYVGVLAKIDQLFTPPENVSGVIRLSTIHQCKGQEEDVVYIIKPSLLPHPCAKDSMWQLEQEENLKYVAITRAKHELYYFMDDTDDDD